MAYNNLITSQEVQAKIKAAFSTTKYPGDENIISHYCEECLKVQEDFKGQEWQWVPKRTFEYHTQSLPLFTPAAYRYYLPAYLLRAVNEAYKESVSLIPESIIYSFVEKENTNKWPDPSGRFFDRVYKFSQEQQEAIELFLWFYSQQLQGKEFLELYIMQALETLDYVWSFSKPA